MLGMKKINTSAYHPQTDGLVERMNRTLLGMIAKHAEFYGEDWDRYLAFVLFAYRVKPHSSTGESPFFLMYGRDARLPTESVLEGRSSIAVLDADDYKTDVLLGFSAAWQLAQESVLKSQIAYKKQYDTKTRDFKFKEGDRVLVERVMGRRSKLACPFEGPYRLWFPSGPCGDRGPLPNRLTSKEFDLALKKFPTTFPSIIDAVEGLYDGGRCEDAPSPTPGKM